MDIWYLNTTDTSLMLLVTHVYGKLSDIYFVIFLILPYCEIRKKDPTIGEKKDFIVRHCHPCVQQTFFPADILIYLSRKSTGVINIVNSAAGLFKCPRRPLHQRYPFILHSQHFLSGVWNRFCTCAFTVGISNIITDMWQWNWFKAPVIVCIFLFFIFFRFFSVLLTLRDGCRTGKR